MLILIVKIIQLLAESGIDISSNEAALATPNGLLSLRLHKDFNDNVAILKIFPGINKKVAASILNIKSLKGLILETFGSRNIPSKSWFIECLKKVVEKQIIILNVNQCSSDKLIQ